mmetsp:Transcript_17893/g.33649  ORF Transcript_17893/g.33649 Transcript_17893/m.33649 type:complete len:133 (-) Transcript_17893:66-464(-)
MIELRHRTNSRGYQALSVDESEDEPDRVVMPRAVDPPTYFDTLKSKSDSNLCLWALLCLSISGTLFLSFIAHQLESNSVYLKVSKINENRKPELAAGVEGAVFLYLLTAVFCLWRIYRCPHQAYKDPHRSMM